MNHYDFIDEHFADFLVKIGLNPDFANGIGTAHGDKAYGYKAKWEKAGIHFYHGIFLFLLAYLPPYSKEVRNTPDGFVSVNQWVVDNIDRFRDKLPEIPDGIDE